MLTLVAVRSSVTGIIGQQTVAAQKEAPSETSEQWADPNRDCEGARGVQTPGPFQETNN